MIGGRVETWASFEARYAPLSYPTAGEDEQRSSLPRPCNQSLAENSWTVRPRSLLGIRLLRAEATREFVAATQASLMAEAVSCGTRSSTSIMDAPWYSVASASASCEWSLGEP